MSSLREALAAAFREALDSIDVAALVEAALPPRPPKRARVQVIAVGKAAIAMSRGAVQRWRGVDTLIVAPAPSPSPPPSPSLLLAPHPIPDARSVAAAERALELARSLRDTDLLLALVSGGASSLLALPPKGVSIEEKSALVASLLEAGAPIRDVNLVRRHFSRIKGGRLAAAAKGARVLTLIASDVIGGAAHDIGSGPTVPDPTTAAEAAAALDRWVPMHSAKSALSHDIPSPPRTRSKIIVEPASLAHATAAALERAGFRPRVDPSDEGDAAAVVDRRLATAATLRPREAVVIACEPTLRLPSARGKGGRAGWIALALARRLPPGVAFLAGASDGVDGSSGAAGACIDRDVTGGIDDATIDVALRDFDDASIHVRLGTALHVAPGNNLADVHVLLRG